MSLEPVIRPFQDQDVTPVRYVKPGQAGVPPVRVTIGIKGGTKTFTFTGSANVSTKLGAVHKEKPSQSQVINKSLASATS